MRVEGEERNGEKSAWEYRDGIEVLEKAVARVRERGIWEAVSERGRDGETTMV
jgi:hypothetical protein